ncbi:ISAon1 family transposase N-terminal region protein [Dyadobacter bucti]|uniref:ISAon1 family transposase N-terminal region protein n=1 Tax=Dyadobacter bucti TaxID=2572203 RepID=UPI004042D78F
MFLIKPFVLESFLPLIELILPDFVIENYTLTLVDKPGDRYHVHLEEKNYSEDDPRKADLLSKGYFPPLPCKISRFERTMFFFMSNVADGSLLRRVRLFHRDWNEVAEGTRMTSEFSAFFKEISVYEG